MYLKRILCMICALTFVSVDCKCLYLIGIGNGTVTYPSPTRNAVGQQVQFSCLEGWTLDGPAMLTCQEDGQWSGTPPTCRSSRCPHIRGIQDGTTLEYRNEAGGKARFKCNRFYKLIGANEITCLDNQEWSSMPPKCIAGKCPDVIFFPNGSVGKYRNRPGTTTTFRCDSNYDLVGNANLRCTETLRWNNPVPKCVCKPGRQQQCEQAQKNRCPWVATIPDGTAKTKTRARIGSWVDFTCNSKFRRVGPRSLKCASGGKWGGDLPRCIPNTCPHFENVLNGKVGTPGRITAGQFITIRCNPGFRRVGQRRLKCVQRTLQWWDNTMCVENRCPELESIENGFVENYSSAPLSTMTWRCDPGFSLRRASQPTRRSSPNNKCRSRNLKWTNPDVICVPNS